MMNQIRNRVPPLTKSEGDPDWADHPIFEKAAHYGFQITDVWSPQEGQRAGSQTVVLGHIDRPEWLRVMMPEGHWIWRREEGKYRTSPLPARREGSSLVQLGRFLLNTYGQGKPVT